MIETLMPLYEIVFFYFILFSFPFINVSLFIHKFVSYFYAKRQEVSSEKQCRYETDGKN